jgi:hypothetical protein
MKTVNISLMQDRINQVASLYPTQKEGLATCVENYIILRSAGLASLKGIFTKEELITLLDLHNGTMYEPRFSSPGILIAHLEDGQNLEGICDRQGSDFDEIKIKIEKLNHLQSLVLIEECWRFWYVDESYSQNIDKFLISLT